MTDRVQNLTVVLDEDYLVDDVEWIINAIRMIKGVKVVEMGPVVDLETHMARLSVHSQIQSDILDLLNNLRVNKRK